MDIDPSHHILLYLIWLLLSGEVTPAQFGAHAEQILTDAYTTAAATGRAAAGDPSPVDEHDRALAAGIMATERKYLKGFVKDIAGGKYGDVGQVAHTTEDEAHFEDFAPDGVDADEIRRRAGMYMGRVVGAANEAWVLASPEGSTFEWILGANEDHCSMCPELAAGGPYTADTLPTVPGANETPCLFNCKCHLRRDDGAVSFTPSS